MTAEMNVETHSIMDGKVQLYKREESRFWQCSTYMDGQNHRTSTKEETLTMAKEFAREWYMIAYADSVRRNRNARTSRLLERFEPKVNLPAVIPQPNVITPATASQPVPQDAPAIQPSEIFPPRNSPQPFNQAPTIIIENVAKPSTPTFKEAAEKFLAEYEIMTEGQRSKEWTWQHRMRIEVHLLPFFGDKPVSEINAGLVNEYRIRRRTIGHRGRKPGRSTLHHETVTLRMVLKTAHNYGWLQFVPNISAPYKTSGKVKHRAWFSKEEYETLYEETRKRSENPPKDKYNERYKYVWEDLHDYVLFMGNTGLRADEAAILEYRDVKIVKDQATGERILEIEVRGKRGVGFCKSTKGAVYPFQRMRKRHNGQPTDKIFGRTPRVVLNKVLVHLKLKFDRDGNVRTAGSLRHTYICLRLMDGADIYQIAKNCRTSVKMIHDFYAIHLKNYLDAAKINVRKITKKSNKNKEETNS
ncbi:MAG: site-specific integrase [Micavibrio sp.]|nr:site-specific integrase [Micavibrio sp.]